MGGLDVFNEARTWPSVIAERAERRGRDRGDGIGADEFLDVHDVAIGGVLRAGARPQQALRLRAQRRQRLPPGACEYFSIFVIRELGIGDGNLAGQRSQELLLARRRAWQSFGDERLDRPGVEAVE